ncbi:MAG: hypothetical protein ABL930_00835 [Pseudobdellovibrio sp.]
MFKTLGTAIKLLLFTLIIAACSSHPCKVEDRTDIVMTGNEKVSSSNKDLTKRVFVYKPDGSQQCGMGEKMDIIEMKKQLGQMQVFSQESKHDGMMRIQVCGQPTGQCNVYEISNTDLDQALKFGFKKWNRD